MAYKLQIRRGLLSALPVGISGEPLFATDTNDLYISNGTTNQKFQKFIASGTSSQFIKGDGSLDSTTYQPLLTNPVTGTGTTNYLTKWTSGSAIGNSNLINDASGNLGLGVQPSAWGSSYKVLQFPGGYVGSDSTLVNGLGQNFYWSGSSNLYVNNGFASDYYQYLGQHVWKTAPSGTAGNAITFTQAMTLTANGRLLLGTTTEGTELLQVNGTMILKGVSYPSISFDSDATSITWSLYSASSSDYFAIYNGTTDVLKFASTGAATFSSSVTATSFIKSGGTSSQYLMADGSVTTGGGGGSVDELQVALICQVFG